MIRREGDRIELEGPVTLATVPELAAAGESLLREGAAVVDFSKVTEVDSAAVALALEWLRQAGVAGTRLQLANLPEAMRNLAGLYGVSEFLLPTSS